MAKHIKCKLWLLRNKLKKKIYHTITATVPKSNQNRNKGKQDKGKKTQHDKLKR
jgi:hypothetical protein